ncbi:MAG: long-chain fatty acid--CoA ligase, partial [Bacteroidota bacterium]|nr:long-chain fatty acid--CoA ligase [Bacteroidota bacterium]
LKESPYVENIMVIGAGEKYVGALIVPAFSRIREWGKQQNISFDGNESIAKNEKVRDLLKLEIEHYNKHFNHVEQVKKFELLSHEWGVETGEMTPKLSLKRKVIMEKYKEAVKRIYN